MPMRNATRTRMCGVVGGFLGIVLVGVLAACSDPEEPFRVPRILAFEADPRVVPVGERVTLSWEVDGASSVTLRPGDVDVTSVTSLVVFPEDATIYTLVAVNRAGERRRSVSIEIGEAPVVGSFVASPPAVEAGEAVTLSWDVAGASSLVVEPGGVDVSEVSSLVVEPVVSTTYRLVAGNAFGEREAEADVEVAPGIVAFEADPPVVPVGEPVTLSWEVLGATSLTLLPGDVDVTAETSMVVFPEDTTLYTLVATNGTGERTRNVSVIAGLLPDIAAFTIHNDSLVPLVNPGVAITLGWSVADATTVTLEGPGTNGIVPVPANGEATFTPDLAGALYRLTASNEIGSVEAELVATRDVPAFGVLIAGQSNAKGINVPAIEATTFITAAPGVAMLGNDYVWKPAYEPTGDCLNHQDLVSADPSGGCTAFAQNSSGVSFGVSLANGIAAATGGEAFLVPSAKNGSSVAQWLLEPAPGEEREDTLYGSAAVRAALAGEWHAAPFDSALGGTPYGAVVWYQGETETSNNTRILQYFEDTDAVLQAFEGELGAPVILVQLSRRGPTSSSDTSVAARNLNYQRVREIQRRMEQGALTPTQAAAPEARAGRFLVVTHDLPMAYRPGDAWPEDGRHLSAAGQVELGRRIALAVRQHWLGEDVDGSGPRLVRVVKSSTTVVRVHLDQAIAPFVSTGTDAYAAYFAVFSAGSEVPIADLRRDPSDTTNRTVRITLAQAVAGAVQVRYMPPPGFLDAFELDVIRAAECAEPMPGVATHACLPLPAFGAAATEGTLRTLRFLVFEED